METLENTATTLFENRIKELEGDIVKLEEFVKEQEDIIQKQEDTIRDHLTEIKGLKSVPPSPQIVLEQDPRTFHQQFTPGISACGKKVNDIDVVVSSRSRVTCTDCLLRPDPLSR